MAKDIYDIYQEKRKAQKEAISNSPSEFYLENHLNNIKFKLLDFGFSRVVALNEKCETFVANNNIITKQMFFGEKYSFEFDYQGIGVQIYYLLFKKYPFEGRDFDDFKKKRESGDYIFPIKRKISIEITRMVVSLLDEKLTKDSLKFDFDFLKHPVEKFNFYRNETEIKFSTKKPAICLISRDDDVLADPQNHHYHLPKQEVFLIDYTFFEQKFN